MGSRVGTKRNDKRWRAGDGEIWASEFEYRVFQGLQRALGPERVYRCEPGEGDSFRYHTPTKEGLCVECGSGDTVQRRIYTPDLYVVSAEGTRAKCYIETKGHFPADKRSLLSHFSKTGEGIDLVVILQRDSRATKKRSLSEWIKSYCGYTSFVYNPCKKPTKKDPDPTKVPDDLVAYLLQ